MELRHSGSPRPKKFRVKNPLDRFTLLLFGIKTASSSGQNIKAEFYSSLLVQLKDILKNKRRGKVTKGALLHDNTLAHLAIARQKKVVYLGFQYPEHPLYFPHLAPPVPCTENTIEIRPKRS